MSYIRGSSTCYAVNNVMLTRHSASISSHPLHHHQFSHLIHHRIILLLRDKWPVALPNVMSACENRVMSNIRGVNRWLQCSMETQYFKEISSIFDKPLALSSSKRGITSNHDHYISCCRRVYIILYTIESNKLFVCSRSASTAGVSESYVDNRASLDAALAFALHCARW